MKYLSSKQWSCRLNSNSNSVWESDNFDFELCSLCLPESSMDLHATGQSCLSFGFLSLAYGLRGHMVLMRHDLVSIIFLWVMLVLMLICMENDGFWEFLKGLALCYVSKKPRTHFLKLEMLGVMGLVLVHCALLLYMICKEIHNCWRKRPPANLSYQQCLIINVSWILLCKIWMKLFKAYIATQIVLLTLKFLRHCFRRLKK